MKKLRTHYDNLKVSPRASAAEIRKAYRRLASIHHPDRNNNSATSVKAMQCINKAYDVLSNSESRAAHDTWIANNDYGCTPTPPPQSPSHKPAQPEYKTYEWGNPFDGTKWSSFHETQVPPAFDPREFPPRNWNPEHFNDFSRYAIGMRRLLDGDEFITLNALYLAFLMDKKVGNLNHTTAFQARQALKRAQVKPQGVVDKVEAIMAFYNDRAPFWRGVCFTCSVAILISIGLLIFV